MAQIRRVLISVTDKTGILDFARALAESGAELISTGGTARLIRDAGIAVQDVSDITGFPEMLDGRVKTLHPKIHGGILAIRGNAGHMRAIGELAIMPIDMVVINLYRFEEAAAKAGARMEDLIENIDIGGPAMIRSAAKNHQDVAVVVSPADYDAILMELRANGGALSAETHWRLAKRAFRTTADYDAAISARLEQVDSPGPLPLDLNLRAPKLMDLRYGENPHQQAALYGRPGAGIAGAEQLHGKELSYNNLVDLDAAYQLAAEFAAPAVAIVKHTNPCGCAEQESLAEAYRKALECDPVSAYGGVIGINRAVDEETAREIARLFVEAIAAPDYSPEALAILTGRDVYLWPDNDRVGAEHMARTGNAVDGLASYVFIIRWPGAPEHGDAFDYIAAGLDPWRLIGSARWAAVVDACETARACRDFYGPSWAEELPTTAERLGRLIHLDILDAERDPLALAAALDRVYGPERTARNPASVTRSAEVSKSRGVPRSNLVGVTA